MKVFISWSGDTSKNIAEIFRQWLPSVIQVVKPYYSPDDITKGTRWSSEIAKELDESKLGIICLTKDNLSSPWIMFEAGALSKNMENSKVCPILFGVEPSDIEGPLVQFQSAKFNKNEVKKVVRMINMELGEMNLTSEVFESVFEMWWPRLEERIEAELNKAKKSTGKEIRSERDLLEEILSLSRTISLVKENGLGNKPSMNPSVIEDLIGNLQMLYSAISEDDKNSSINILMNQIDALKYIVNISNLPSLTSRILLRRLNDFTIELEEYHLISKRPIRRRALNKDLGNIENIN